MWRWPQSYLSNKGGQLVTTERFLRERGISEKLQEESILQSDPKLINEKTGETETIEERSDRMWADAKERRGKLAEDSQLPEVKVRATVAKAAESLAQKEENEEGKEGDAGMEYKEDLIAKARAMWVSVAPNWAVKTIENKIAEAESQKS